MILFPRGHMNACPGRRITMNKMIDWITDFKEAFDQANVTNKMVLLDFFNPH